MSEHSGKLSKEFVSEIGGSDPSMLAKRQLYEEIDWNENSFNGVADGIAHFYIAEGKGDCLYLIEEFVEEIAKGKRGFSKETCRRGLFKSLELSKYFPMMNTFLRLYSPSKIYSPHIDLFYSVCITNYGLMSGDFNKPSTYSSTFRKREGEFFNQLIQEIFLLSSKREFKRKQYARDDAVKRGYASALKYVNALFERYSRLLVLRIDFGFRTINPARPHPLGLQDAQTHFAHFLNNKRGKKIYASLKGYIWRLEYGKQKGYHYHLFFFFDGSKVHKDEYLANLIGGDWDMISNGEGIYYNCNAHKQNYKRLGIGMISHFEEEKRRILLEVLAYMHKQDQTLREKHSEKTHSWGRGEMPTQKKTSVGRPRIVAEHL
jgi:hypothetical protein